MAKKTVTPKSSNEPKKSVIKNNSPQKMVVKYVDDAGTKQTLVINSREIAEVVLSASLEVALREYKKRNLITIKK